jgi:hypothetical protein
VALSAGTETTIKQPINHLQPTTITNQPPNVVNWHMASVGTETAIIGSQRQATIISLVPKKSAN